MFSTVDVPAMLTQVGSFVAPVVLVLVIGLGLRLAPWFLRWVSGLLVGLRGYDGWTFERGRWRYYRD